MLEIDAVVVWKNGSPEDAILRWESKVCDYSGGGAWVENLGVCGFGVVYGDDVFGVVMLEHGSLDTRFLVQVKRGRNSITSELIEEEGEFQKSGLSVSGVSFCFVVGCKWFRPSQLVVKPADRVPPRRVNCQSKWLPMDVLCVRDRGG